MKLFFLGVLFLAIPYVLLNSFVMPQLRGLEKMYSNADAIAENVAKGKPVSPEINGARCVLQPVCQ
jgi:hypothetical protein